MFLTIFYGVLPDRDRTLIKQIVWDSVPKKDPELIFNAYMCNINIVHEMLS